MTDPPASTSESPPPRLLRAAGWTAHLGTLGTWSRFPKYLTFLTRRSLVSRFIPYAAVLAVAFGVFAFIPVLSVMEGFKDEMRSRIRGSLSHLVLVGERYLSMHGEDETVEALQGVEHVVAVSPFVQTIAIYKSVTIDHCVLRCVDPVAEARVGELGEYLLRDTEIYAFRQDPEYRLPESREPLSEADIEAVFSLERRRRVRLFSSFYEEEEGGFAGEVPPQPIVVGIEAIRRGAMEIGHTVQLASFSPIDYSPRIENFIVVGAFKSGIFEQDLQWIYMPLPAAKEFLELYDGELEDYRIGGISVRLDDYTHAPAVKATIQEEVVQGLPSPGCEVLTWEDQRATLLRAVGVEKRIITVMMMLLVVFAGVVIFLILTLMGIEKTRDLGVLRSLGATGRGVVGLFLLQGMVLCAVGTILGIVAGWGLTANLNAVHDWITSVTGWRLFPSDVYYLSKIPTRMMWNDWAVILGPAVLFGFLGSIIPAVWAARQDPILALRHE